MRSRTLMFLIVALLYQTMTSGAVRKGYRQPEPDPERVRYYEGLTAADKILIKPTHS